MGFFRVFALAVAKTLSKLFGLATITFFGRVPSADDDKVGAMGLISVTWYVVLAAIAYPPLGELIFPFLHDEEIIRGIAIFLAITMPPVVGFLVTRMQNRRHERGLRQVGRELLFGYGYAVVIGGLVLALIIVVPVVKSSYILRMFDLKHVAVMIEGERYQDVLEEMRRVLDEHGLETTVEQPHWTIYRIFTALAWMEGHIFRREVAQEMLLLRGHTDAGEKFEVTLHATDISILGSQHATTLVLAILAENLTEDHLYFTWDDEAQAVEDRIYDLKKALQDGSCTPTDDDIQELCADLRQLSLSSEEWNAVRRRLFALESACLRSRLAALQEEGDEEGRDDGEDAAGRQSAGDSASSSGSSAVSSAVSESSSPRT